MSPIIEFDDADFMRKVVEPAWYRVRVEDVTEALSKDGGSTNYNIESTIRFNGDNGSTKYQGVIITWNINSKFKSAAIGFLSCFGINAEPRKRYELANAIGKELDVFVENDTWQGRVVNRVNHKYRSPHPDVVAVS